MEYMTIRTHHYHEEHMMKMMIIMEHQPSRISDLSYQELILKLMTQRKIENISRNMKNDLNFKSL